PTPAAAASRCVSYSRLVHPHVQTTTNPPSSLIVHTGGPSIRWPAMRSEGTPQVHVASGRILNRAFALGSPHHRPPHYARVRARHRLRPGERPPRQPDASRTRQGGRSAPHRGRAPLRRPPARGGRSRRG